MKLGNIAINEIETKEARSFKAVGAIGNVELQEAKNGYVQVIVPLSYRLTAADSNDRQFVARFNLRPEWLTQEFSHKVKTGTVAQNEAIQYNINVRGLLKGLLTGAGLDEHLSVDAAIPMLTGKIVGFRTKPRRDDPSRLDIAAFFTPRN